MRKPHEETAQCNGIYEKRMKKYSIQYRYFKENKKNARQFNIKFDIKKTCSAFKIKNNVDPATSFDTNIPYYTYFLPSVYKNLQRHHGLLARKGILAIQILSLLLFAPPLYRS